MKRLPYLLGATGLGLALTTVSCTTLGTHVKGGFACKAPQGTCAPMSNIDAQAIASLGTNGAMPVATDNHDGAARFITTDLQGGTPVRTGEHVMRVVFPAHTDQAGVFHEEAVAHVVSDHSGWTLRPADAPPAGSLDAAIAAAAPSIEQHAPDGSVSVVAAAPQPATVNAPLNLREAAAGLSAPPIQMAAQVEERVATDIPAGAPGAPTEAALAAARAGHRIGDASVAATPAPATRHTALHGKSHHHPVHQVAATIPGAATATLNRAALARLLAATRAHQLASAAPAGGEQGQ